MDIVHEDARAPLATGRTLFDHADGLGLRVASSCGRSGRCHECVVRVEAGGDALSAPSAAEAFLPAGYRLACQAVVERTAADIEVSLLQSRLKILTASRPRASELDPRVRRVAGHVVRDGQVLDEDRGRVLGLAVDVGTTTVVAELVDLETGQTAGLASFVNPQRFGGSDVMHRISYDAGPYRGELHQAIVNALNHELRELCRRLDLPRHAIYDVVVVGNSTMRDLFFDLDVQSIGQRPYRSRVEEEHRAGRRDTTALDVEARTLRLWTHPRARVWGAPLVASHLGADTAAALVAIDAAHGDESVMLVDVGTNTEVVVRHRGRLVAASCPAGPAFEGGGVRHGMAAMDGAIEALRLDAAGVGYDVIGDVAPRGLCGSGLIDALAELRRTERMTPKGVLADRATEIELVPGLGLTLSREDLSQLAQAKAANVCGQRIVLGEVGLAPGRLDRLYLAGGFAEHVNVTNAVAVGFLAPVPEDRVCKVGNAALQGARELLLSGAERTRVTGLLARVEHVELETRPEFFDTFVDGCLFEPMPA